MTSKKVTKYLLGARETMEIFKLYQLRYLLLRIYPLVHNLFHQTRQNITTEFKEMKSAFVKKPWRPSSTDGLPLLEKKKVPFRTKFSFISKRKNTSPQILFATVTPNLSQIIYSAAQICNMP